MEKVTVGARDNLESVEIGVGEKRIKINGKVDWDKIAREIGGLKQLYVSLDLPGLPDDEFAGIPSLDEFVNEKVEFVQCGELVELFANKLKYKFDNNLRGATEAKIKYFWKEQGGKSGGNLIFGKCTKPTGLLAQKVECDIVIWFAFDHCYGAQFTNWQMLALIFHELRHIDYKNFEVGTKGHDYEGFVDEIELFGAWRANSSAVIQAARKLPGME